MKLREAVEEILKRKKEKDRKEYYDKHIRKAVEWCEEMVSKGLKFMLALNKDSLMKDSTELNPKCTRIRAIHYPEGYIEELSTWTYEEPKELYYDAPTATTMPAGYKTYDYKKYFNETIKAYEGCLFVEEKLANSISESRGPKLGGCNYTVKEVKGMIKKFKFKKDLVNSIARKLNEVACYKELHYDKREYLFQLYYEFRFKSSEVLKKQVKYKPNVLFHILQKVGYDPDPEDFPLNGKASNDRTEAEIETVFKASGWNYRPM